MTKDEALRLALEALNKLIIGSEYEDAVQAEDAIKACEEVLAQPTLWMNCQTFADSIHYPKCWDIAAYPTLDDALDEMVAWFEISGCSTCEEELAQPEREWVGLTDEEIYLCTNHIDRNSRGWANEYARAVEAKLKEKNT